MMKVRSHERVREIETQTLSSAIEFVKANGTILEKWAAFKLAGSKNALPENWAIEQNKDGGWKNKDSKSGLSHMGTTTITLIHLILWELAESTETKKTVQFLWDTQQEDGRWTENPDQVVDNLPEYNTIGDFKVDLWVTANNLASLCLLGFKADQRVIKGIEWVEQYSSEDGTYPGYIHTTYAMAAVMWVKEENIKAEKYLQASLLFLKKYKNEDWYDTMEFTWSLMLWMNAKINGNHKVVKTFLEELKASQQPNGIWKSIYPGCDAGFTIEALWILNKYSLLS